MAWEVVPFQKLYYSVNGGTEYEWNGTLLPIRYQGAISQIANNGGTFNEYTYRRTRYSATAEFQAMYNSLNGGNGLDFWYYIKKKLANNQNILIYKESGNANIAFVIQRVSNSQYRFGCKFYSSYTWLSTGSTMVYVAGGSGQEGNTHASVIKDPTLNIGFITNGSLYNAYCCASWGNQSSDSSYDENVYRSYTVESNNQVSAAISYLLFGNTPPPPPPPPATDEPYGGDDYDESSGGDGEHDDTSDTIAQSAIPVAAATRTGMCTAYVPTWGEIKDVASALLDPNIFQILAQNVVKLSDVVIGLSVFPCAISATDTGTVKANVLGIEIGTGVVCHIADDQYVEFDCGSLTISEYWGNCLDYNPYTRISIFLPFCGMYELDTDEVMGKTLNVSYRVDIFSGACLATIKIDGSVFYQYSGQCSSQVPLSSVSFDSFLGSMLDIGIATATGVGAVGAAGAAVSQAKGEFGIARKKGVISASKNVVESVDNYNKVKEQSGNAIADAAVGAVVGSKGFYQHAGAMSGSPGFLGVRYPYIIIKRPEQIIPRMYGKYHGFPANTSAVLGDLVGYTEVNDIRLNIPEATVDEIIECEQLLKGGVVI